MTCGVTRPFPKIRRQGMAGTTRLQVERARTRCACRRKQRVSDSQLLMRRATPELPWYLAAMTRKVTLVAVLWWAIIFAQAASLQTTNVPVLRFQRFVTTVSGDRSVEFTLSNAASRSIWFTGYSLHSPLYSIEHQEGTRWVPQQIGWCGTGLDRQQLKANESI